MLNVSYIIDSFNRYLNVTAEIHKFKQRQIQYFNVKFKYFINAQVIEENDVPTYTSV